MWRLLSSGREWGCIYCQATLLYSSSKLKDRRGYTQKRREGTWQQNKEAKGWLTGGMRKLIQGHSWAWATHIQTENNITIIPLINWIKKEKVFHLLSWLDDFSSVPMCLGQRWRGQSSSGRCGWSGWRGRGWRSSRSRSGCGHGLQGLPGNLRNLSLYHSWFKPWSLWLAVDIHFLTLELVVEDLDFLLLIGIW